VPQIDRHRDAILALYTAYTHLIDVVQRRLKNVTEYSDPEIRDGDLQALSMANQQLDQAATLEPSAVLTLELEDDGDIVFSQNELRANCLHEEGFITSLTNAINGVAIIDKAISLDPDNAGYHASAGRVYLEELNKQKSIYHFQRAVDLNPNDMEYRRHLDIAENLSSLAKVADTTGRVVDDYSKLYGIINKIVDKIPL